MNELPQLVIKQHLPRWRVYPGMRVEELQRFPISGMVTVRLPDGGNLTLPAKCVEPPAEGFRFFDII